MSHDPQEIGRNNAPSPAITRCYAIARHSGNEVVAVRAQQQIDRARFLGDIGSLAARLPPRQYVLNLCTDRYHFTVGLAAALCRRQISLLPPGDAPPVLQALKADYPDLYALTDTLRPAVESVVYPHDLGHDGPALRVPEIPGVQPAVILFTSGSTGSPRAVPKSWGTLVQSALAAGDRLGIAELDGATIISTVPHQHSYGLESIILLGLQHGLAIDGGRPFYPADIGAAIEAAPRPRILVTTPLHLRVLVGEPYGMPDVDLILSATAPLSVELAAEAEACFRARLVEIYGCTEAGQIATRRTLNERHWHCLDGVTLHQDECGTWASGSSVEGRAKLHDLIEWSGPATFLLGGRSADLVDIAGKRTSLAHLNHLLLGIEGVEDGIFFVPDPDPRRIARLMAVVVAPGLEPQAILRALRERVDSAFLPRPLVCVDRLPRNALGKTPREALLQLAGRGGFR